MRIVYVLPGLGVCGGVRVVFEHCNRLMDLGHDVAIAVTAEPSGQNWFPLRVTYGPAFRLTRMVEEADVVVATAWQTASWVHEAASRARKYYFVQMRESLFTNYAGWKKDAEATYALPLRPVTISQWLKRFLEDEYGHRDVPVIPNGVNRDMFYPDPYYPKREGTLRILVEGHEANAAKNVGDAFRAISRVRNWGVPLEVWGFNQVGQGRYPYDRFFFNPDQDTIRRLYSSADLLLKTTRYEGRSCVHVEAMACGCPVVTTDCRGTDDFRPGRNCLLAPYGDVEALAGHVRDLYQYPQVRHALAVEGLAYVREHLPWGPLVDQLEAIYAK